MVSERDRQARREVGSQKNRLREIERDRLGERWARREIGSKKNRLRD